VGDIGPGGQVFLRQVRLGPVITELGAEHARRRPAPIGIGGELTLRAEVRQDHVRIEVEYAGGPWHGGPRDDARPHGFDVVAAIAGSQNWGIGGDTRGRTAWARLGR
jgi:hypothetical protein